MAFKCTGQSVLPDGQTDSLVWSVSVRYPISLHWHAVAQDTYLCAKQKGKDMYLRSGDGTCTGVVFGAPCICALFCHSSSDGSHSSIPVLYRAGGAVKKSFLPKKYGQCDADFSRRLSASQYDASVTAIRGGNRIYPVE